MRIDKWAGLVTDASPFATDLPAGAATTLVNLRPSGGALESRQGMRRIAFAGAGTDQDLVDCCSVTIGGVPVVLALASSGSLLALRSPTYSEAQPAVPFFNPCAQDGELLIDYAQNLAGATIADEVPTCLPGTPGPPSDPSVGFWLDGGSADGSYYEYLVDAMRGCPTLPEVDGGDAPYDGTTLLTEASLCGFDQPPPPPPGNVPSVPLNLDRTFSAESAALTWDAPASDGGQPVTGYEVQISLDGTDWFEQPGAPGPASVTFGDQTAALTWTAPANTGDLPITAYEVAAESSTDGGITWTAVSL